MLRQPRGPLLDNEILLLPFTIGYRRRGRTQSTIPIHTGRLTFHLLEAPVYVCSVLVDGSLMLVQARRGYPRSIRAQSHAADCIACPSASKCVFSGLELVIGPVLSNV